MGTIFGMTRPITRVLALLKLLQQGGTRTVAELARRLDVDERTVRRYVDRLVDLDIPVRSVRGRYGGYHLSPGYRMPPLMLTDEEAVAVLLGLVAGQRTGVHGTSVAAAESAAAKVRRVLPKARATARRAPRGRRLHRARQAGAHGGGRDPVDGRGGGTGPPPGRARLRRQPRRRQRARRPPRTGSSRTPDGGTCPASTPPARRCARSASTGSRSSRCVTYSSSRAEAARWPSRDHEGRQLDKARARREAKEPAL